MPKKIHLPSTPRHVVFFDEDWDYLESRFGSRGIRPIGISTVIRAIIHSKVLSLKAAEINRQDTIRATPPGVSGSLSQTPIQNLQDEL